MVILFMYLWRWFLSKLFLLVCFLQNGKKKILFTFTKKVTNKILKIIDQFLYFWFVVKYLKDLFLTKYLSISPLINSSLKKSLVSKPVIPVSTLSITHGIIIDISKTLDEVWHERLTFKLKQNGISVKLFHILSDFLIKGLCLMVKIRQGRISWDNVHAWFPQGSIPGPLLFLIYIKDLSDNLTRNAKLFYGNTSLFPVAHDVNTSAKKLNDDLKKVNCWAFEWKMSFNSDRSKQAQKVIPFANQRDQPTHL